MAQHYSTDYGTMAVNEATMTGTRLLLGIAWDLTAFVRASVVRVVSIDLSMAAS